LAASFTAKKNRHAVFGGQIMKVIAKRGRQGFSLAETLVVVAIIALMACLIVGAAAKAYKAVLNLKATVEGR
jgi:prepilin-type N-terminal cleavage/methylation domain-containing protein